MRVKEREGSVAQANGSTDPTLSSWVPYNPSFNNPYAHVRLGLSVSVPLRIFDRNQGEKLRTSIDIDRNQRVADAARAQVCSDVESAYEQLRSSVTLLVPYRDMARGILAVLVGTAVLVIPDMMSLIPIRPLTIAMLAVCLAAYGTIDSGLVVAISFMIPHNRPGRLALRMQGAIGAVIGIVLFATVSYGIDLSWFLYLAVGQAGIFAVAEFIVARGTSIHHGARWCYVSSAIATVSAVALAFGKRYSPEEIVWLIFAYLVLFGFNALALSARMLFAERDLFPIADALRAKRTATE